MAHASFIAVKKQFILMKKKLNYPLLALVLLLWGAIFYRVFSGLKEDQPITPARNATPHVKTVKEHRPSAGLLLDYRDPFLGSGVDEAYEGADEYSYMEGDYLEAEPYVDWSMITFYGAITSDSGAKTVALVRINGQEYLLKLGETVEGFTLLGKKGNSITVRHQGQVGTITMQEDNNE